MHEADGRKYPGAQTPIRVLHLVYREGFSSVFRSQVLRPFEWSLADGIDAKVCVFTTLGEMIRPTFRSKWRNALNACRDDARQKISHIPCGHRLGGAAWDKAIFSLWLRLHYKKEEPILLHCRNEFASLIGTAIRSSWPNMRVILDYRGVGHEEIRYTYQKSHGGQRSDEVDARAAESFRIEREAARQADAVICVSNAMSSYVTEAYGVEPSKIVVTPCVADPQIFDPTVVCPGEVRTKLGLQGRFIVTYSGSLDAWQVPERSLDIFKKIQAINPNAHFLALTTQPERMKQLTAMQDLGPNDATILSVAPGQVPRYLMASDVAVLLREPSLVNWVASPVKFAEYLASGLPVIISAELGDYSELTRSHRVGVVLNQEVDDVQLNRLLGEFMNAYLADPSVWRSRCRALAASSLSPEVWKSKIYPLYDRLSNDILHE